MVSSEYAAGFFDGEGGVAISGSTYKGTRVNSRGATRRIDHVKWTRSIYFCNTHYEVLELIQNKYGGVLRQTSQPSYKRKAVFRLTLHSSASTAAAIDMLPFLIVKKKQVELYLEFASTLYKSGYHSIPREVVWKRHLIYRSLHAVNSFSKTLRKPPKIGLPRDWPYDF